MSDDAAQAIIQDGQIIIRVSLDHLPQIVEAAWATSNLSPRFKITDQAAFAKDLCRALNNEDEVGSTPIHYMFDKAIREAIEQGAEGIEKHEEQDA